MAQRVHYAWHDIQDHEDHSRDSDDSQNRWELTGEGVAELEKAWASVDGPVDLDLSQLMAADAEGVRALKNVLGSGARLVAASLYVELLIKSEA